MRNNLKNITSALIFGMLLLSITACKKTNDCCVNIDTDVQILYKNQIGENLLNSTAEFNESNIKIYYKNGDEFQYMVNGSLSSPRMFKIYPDEEDNLILTIFTSNFYDGNKSTTLIELNRNVVDTLVCEYDLASNREVVTNAWLNGVQMDNKFIEIQK